MKGIIKKWLSACLAVLMIMLLPVSVNAEDDLSVYDGPLFYNLESGDVTVLFSKADEVPETVKIKAEVNGVKIIGISGWGFSYSKAKYVILPDTIQQIREYAFQGSNIRELIIPSKVGYVDRAMAVDCAYLEKVVFKTNLVRELPSNTFGGCTRLKEIKLPSHLERIEYSAFGACHSLEKLTLPDSVLTIGDSAFAECLSLSEIYIPPSVIDIAGNAFTYDKKVTIKGAKNSYAEYYATANKIPFKAVGKPVESITDRPMIKSVSVKGNTAKVELFPNMKKGTEYDFLVLDTHGYTPAQKQSMFPNIRRVTTKKTSITFYNLPKGEFSVYAVRADNGKGWSNDMTIKIAKDPVKTPKLNKVSVKGRTVTATFSNLSGSKGYDSVLAKRWDEKPYTSVYVKKNQKTATITFKNVKPGVYYVSGHAFVKQNITSGKKQFSNWSNYKKITVS